MNTSKIKITLSDSERLFAETIISEQKENPKIILRARILLLSDSSNTPELTVSQIADEVNTSRQTVTKIRNVYQEQGFSIALNVLNKTSYGKCPINNRDFLKKITDIINSTPPNNRSKWSLRAICSECVKRGYVKDYISPTTISKMLKKNNIQL